MSDADEDYQPTGERRLADQEDFGLDSDAGNARLRVVLAEIVAQAERGEIERAEALVFLSDAVQELSADHPEVTDLSVRNNVVTVLDPVFVAQGWARLEPFEF